MKSAALHLDVNWLREQYVVNGLSTYKIAAMVHRNPKRVYEKLVASGIPTRPRGHNLRGCDNYMAVGGRGWNGGQRGRWDGQSLAPVIPNPFKGKHHSEETRRILSLKASVPKPWLRGSRNGMAGRTGAGLPGVWGAVGAND